jgi:hypothetical protein
VHQISRKMAKRTHPWLLAPLAAETFPSLSSSPSQHEDIPIAKIPRVLVPLSENPETDSSDVDEDIPQVDAFSDSKTSMKLKPSAIRSPPSASTLEYDRKLMSEVERFNQSRNHNSYNEYGKALPFVAPMAQAPTNMPLSGLSGWHPSIYPTTGFTGLSRAEQLNLPSIYPTTEFAGTLLADQVNIQQTLYGVNGYASTAVRDQSQMTSPRSNAWSPWGSTWHPDIAHATSMTNLLGMWIADQDNILKAQQRDYNWNAEAVARGLGQTTSPQWSNTDQPTITQVTGSTAARRVDHAGSILETQQGVKSWDTMLALTTTRPDRNRSHMAMDTPIHTPIDQTIGRVDRLTAAETDVEGMNERKGRWTPEEDSELLRAVEKFSVTRWKTIATLIPGRTKKQCWNRWVYALDPSIARMTERTGKWLTEEDEKLVAAVQKYEGKNWDAIAELVPSRTKRQCMDRWHKCKSETISILACAED